MKIFDKFYQKDKFNELLIEYTDDSMTLGKATMKFDLREIRAGRLTYEDVENQFEDFPESSQRQIRNAFELLKRPSKQICLRNIDKS